MMVYCKSSDTEIKFDTYKFHTLVLENKELLRNICYSFYNGNSDEYFVFSKAYETFEFHKKGMYIPSVIGLDMNNKRLLTKIHTELERLLTEDLCSEYYEAKNQLVLLSEKLMQLSDFGLDCNYDITPRDLIKLLSFEIIRGDADFAEVFVRYVQLLVEYLGISLIVVSDLHCFFNENDLDLIFKTLHLIDVRVLCIEATQPRNLSEYEKLHIIDCELCNIE